MDELSLYILDITMNSVRAGADKISISLTEEGEWLTFSVSDNGCGMKKEQLEKLSNPFFTTRTTRKVGLGIPFLKMLAEMTGGYVEIASIHESESENHGTTTKAVFGKDHIDFIPLGDIAETVVTLVQGSPDIDFTFIHRTERGEVRFSSAEIRAVLGNGISLAEPEILSWIGENIKDQYTLIA
ncbi:MAG: sensor histidine kinase [Clostridia bacterium]|nr:sensor histidine kinase [Clostridia bacterium]